MRLGRLGILAMALMSVAFSSSARPPLVPLMPPRDSASSASETLSAKKSMRNFGKTQLGVEFGMTGRDADSGTDVLGFQVFWGGRVAAKFGIVDDISLKPSVGYFRRSESAALASVVQNQIELGLTGSYQFYRSRRFRWNGNLVNRFDMSFSSLKVSGATQDTPAVLRYRVGPGMGIGVDVGSRIELCADIEYTFGLTSPQRNFSALTTGVLFPL